MSIVVRGNTGLIETAESGRTQISQDQFSVTQIFRGPQSLCESSRPTPGDEGSGDFTGFKVDSAGLDYEPGNYATLTINWIPINGILPPDDESGNPQELPKKIETHPRYSDFTAAEILLIKQSASASTEEEREDADWEISTWDEASKTLAAELANKIKSGKDTYYYCGLTFEWAKSYWEGSLPALSLGGFIDATPGKVDGIEARMYGKFGGMQALRLADKFTFSNFQWRITRSWQMAPDATLDPNIYPTV